MTDIQQPISAVMIHCRIDPEDKTEFALEEGAALVGTYGGQIVHTFSFNVRKISPASYITKGQVEKIQEFIKENNVDFVFWNRILNHRNQRTLENMLQKPVYDRAKIILEIFRARATSSEEKLQVKLACKEYEKSRLVKAWTHLERQRGALGKTGGPGEKQIELDMQMIQNEIKKLKAKIKDFAVSREVQRKSRSDIFLVSLVGYTNVGKTTLFNSLTNASDLAENKLFATLGPHTKKMKGCPDILISDTVGFIRNFPTSLSSAFMHTLEEIKYSSLILHIRDPNMASEDKYSNIIVDALKKLKAESIPRWNVWNKWDLASPEAEQSDYDQTFYVSAKTGLGMEELKNRIKLYKNNAKN